MGEVTIDLVTKRDDGTFTMILVEQGPWTGENDDELRAIQDRLYDYVDVAVDGHLAGQFPESAGSDVVVRVDAYDTPPGGVSAFVSRFATAIANSTEHAQDMQSNGHIASLCFECAELHADS